jgi:hypothetical protein
MERETKIQNTHPSQSAQDMSQTDVFFSKGISLRPNNKDFLMFLICLEDTSLGIHLSLQARDFFLISASKQRSLCPKGEVLLSECKRGKGREGKVGTQLGVCARCTESVVEERNDGETDDGRGVREVLILFL